MKGPFNHCLTVDPAVALFEKNPTLIVRANTARQKKKKKTSRERLKDREVD